jgi:hypothetical protein
LNLLLILKYLSIFQNQIAQKIFDAPLNAVQTIMPLWGTTKHENESIFVLNKKGILPNA